MDGTSSATPAPGAGVEDLTLLQWRKQVKGIDFLVATSRALIDLEFVNKSFATDEMPWARPMSTGELTKMLDKSLTLGLYVNTAQHAATASSLPPEEDVEQVGLARLITDHVTFAYLTDVYVLPEYRRFGHARWLMACCREVLEAMPAIRRGFLVTGLSYGAEFYKETLGFYNVAQEDHIVALTRHFEQR